MNFANLVTSLRVLMIPVVLFFVWKPTATGTFVAVVLVAVAGGTDILDGYLARLRGVETAAGKLLDPIADKLMVISLLILLVGLQHVPPLLVILLVAREIVITGVRAVAAAEKLVIGAGELGKYKTWFQMWALGALILHGEHLGASAHQVGLILLWISLYFSYVSGVQYILGYLVLIRK